MNRRGVKVFLPGTGNQTFRTMNTPAFNYVDQDIYEMAKRTEKEEMVFEYSQLNSPQHRQEM